VIRLTARRDALHRTVDDEQQRIRRRLLNEKLNAAQEAAVTALLARLRGSTAVSIDEAALGRVQVDAQPRAAEGGVVAPPALMGGPGVPMPAVPGEGADDEAIGEEPRVDGGRRALPGGHRGVGRGDHRAGGVRGRRRRDLPVGARAAGAALPRRRSRGARAPELARRSAEVLRTALDRMLDDQLIRRAATRAHLTVSEDDVDEFIGRMATERGATPEQIYAALQQEGVSRTEYRTYMESEVLQLRVLQARVRGRINITDADLQQAYRRAVREAADQTVPTVAHVLIGVAEDATPDQVAAARQRARRSCPAGARGRGLRHLARQMSDDTASRESGGVLGEIQPGSLPEELDRAITALALGGVSDPVQGPAGWHVMRLVSRRAVEPPPFASVRDRLYAALVNREMLRQRGIYLRELRRTVSIDDRLDATRAAAAPPAR
jgi:peptidyl-prolyl cis-trans isomerase SurA